MISLYASLSRFSRILILNRNMLMNYYNITIGLFFSESMLIISAAYKLLIISAVYELTLGKYLAHCSLRVTSLYCYTCFDYQRCPW